MDSNNDYDIIVIGSGLGGLTVGSLMAQMEGKKVLLLEQHYIVGGFTHTFKREKGYKWDVGVHYVGDLDDEHIFRLLFDFLTKGKVSWKQMPHIYDKWVYPDFTVEVPSEPEEFIQALVEIFPDEEEGIRKYMKDVVKADDWYRKNIVYKHLPSLLKPFLKPSASHTRLATMSTREYLDNLFDNQKLKGALVSQWGNYGAVPGSGSFCNHSMVVKHFYKGGYYPVGSSKTIAEAIEPIIEEHGGKILINHEVTDIIVEDGKAVGVNVDVKQGKKRTSTTFKAPIIVSCAGAYNTYTKLLHEDFGEDYPEEVRDHPDGLSHLCLYIGFKESPEKLGFKGENHWIFDEYDHDEMFEDIDAIVDDRMKMAFLSFPSLKDPAAEVHTGEIITYISYEIFEKWREEKWKKRGEEYEAFKEQLASRMLDFIERHYPGFKDLIDFYELSTPLSTEHFTMHNKGCIYGMHTSPERFLKKWNQVNTPVKNLYLTGADAATLGVAGAFTGGLFTSIELMKGSLAPLNYLKVLKRAKKFRKQLQKEGKSTLVK